MLACKPSLGNGHGHHLLVRETSALDTGGLTGKESKIGGLRVESGIAVIHVRGIEAQRGALVVVVLVYSPGGAASDDNRASYKKIFVYNKTFMI